MPCELSGPVCKPERATPPPRDEHMAQTPRNGNGPLDGAPPPKQLPCARAPARSTHPAGARAATDVRGFVRARRRQEGAGVAYQQAVSKGPVQ